MTEGGKNFRHGSEERWRSESDGVFGDFRLEKVRAERRKAKSRQRWRVVKAPEAPGGGGLGGSGGQFRRLRAPADEETGGGEGADGGAAGSAETDPLHPPDPPAADAADANTAGADEGAPIHEATKRAPKRDDPRWRVAEALGDRVLGRDSPMKHHEAVKFLRRRDPKHTDETAAELITDLTGIWWRIREESNAQGGLVKVLVPLADS